MDFMSLEMENQICVVQTLLIIRDTVDEVVFLAFSSGLLDKTEARFILTNNVYAT